MKIKVFSEDLKIGMYICELDCPWIESPFLFQGFPLKNDDEIQQVQATCQYVYVDTDKTPFEVKPNLNTISPVIQKSHKESNVPAENPGFTDSDPSKKSEFDKSNFTQNLVNARKVRDKTRDYIDTMLAEARMGRVVDTKIAKDLVAELASNIASSLDASMWLTQLKNKDEYTAIHSLNVCVLSLTFGRALKLPQDELEELGLGALLHDIGKMRVPLNVLNKPGKLTPDEFEIMKSHPGMGYELLRTEKNLSQEVLAIVRSHHERLNGQGYPDKLNDTSITYFTKIVTITDVYDAITSDRVYHDGMTPHDAMQRLYEWMPDNFDKELVQQFIRTLGIYPIGSAVQLNTGQIGLVVKLNEGHRLKPVVMLIMNRDREYYPQRKLLNLASSIWNKKTGKPEIKRIIDAKEFNIDVKKIIDEESLASIKAAHVNKAVT